MELKWCGRTRDVLYEAVWDIFKLALTTTREDRPACYLLTGASQNVWQTSEFSDLFDDGLHSSRELCERRLPDAKATLAWDDLLRGGYDRYPDEVPADIATVAAGRVPVGAWELRAAQVTLPDSEWLMMKDGWPDGLRPADARHPAEP